VTPDPLTPEPVMDADMRSQRCYFPQEPDAPRPLAATISRRVRFEEIDPLGMVWHGRYVSYLEDGRVTFGDRYGLRYMKFKEEGLAAPIVKMHIDYKAPLRFDEIMNIKTTLHWCDAMRLNFEYHITGQDGRLTATGYTVQLLTDMKGDVLLIPTVWIKDFRQKWKDGKLK
jgi:acyl-CoA thioester hydrolase